MLLSAIFLMIDVELLSIKPKICQAPYRWVRDMIEFPSKQKDILLVFLPKR